MLNLLHAGERTVVIDWVDASAGDPRADVCRTYLLYAQFFEELAEGYLRPSCTRGDVFAWAPLIAGARLSERLPPETAEPLLRIVRQGLA